MKEFSKIKKGLSDPRTVFHFIGNKTYNKLSKLNYLWASRNGEISTEINNWSVELHPEDLHVSRKLYSSGKYDPALVTLLQNLIQPGWHAVDIGSHIGYITLHMADLVGKEGYVTAFEPHPENCKLLKQNIISNGFGGRVDHKNVAVLDRDSKLKMSSHGSNKGAHSLFNEIGSSSVEVETVVGDKDISNNVDLIKIDVEGAEPRVFEGLENTIASDKPYIIFEFDLDLWPSNPIEPLEYMQKFGYEFCEVSGGKSEPLSPKSIVELERKNMLALPE